VVVVVVVVVVTMITTMMKPSDRTAFQRFHLHFGRRWKVLELKFWSLS
jgi:membrane-anchored protein YejM (alkaline phosphatase superfamily)